ncbi:Spy/CpxP family protein refolding chaperone [Paraburkholderia monticola]|uniref:Spy/CpxP family protein refolding chaperone n=1 Tax=Paraburkholderia monticola TaxID=1399968 RepID=UPI0009EEF111|nr:Spy/CpxP family protein refolding chaperone [Paraburkholderia monticola]
MKSNTATFPPGRSSAAIAALFLAITALACPADAATPAQNPAPAHVITVAAHESIDSRINSLHSKLQITQAQEALWQKVAQVMRDNENTMHALRETRMSQMNNMSAMDDLKSYGQAADAHAEGIRKLTPVFQTLYDSMSDKQKKNTDLIFRTEHHDSAKKG